MIALAWLAALLVGVVILVAPATLLWLTGVIDGQWDIIAITMMWFLFVVIVVWLIAIEADQ